MCIVITMKINELLVGKPLVPTLEPPKSLCNGSPFILKTTPAKVE
jgi:hypothetical protein